VLLDYSLPGRNGIEVLKRIRLKYPYLPIVLLTGQGSEAIAVESIKQGAQDYITKSNITRDTLSRAIEMAIERGALKKRIEDQHVILEIFSRALAHDRKEPVRTISSFAQAICDGEVEGDARDEYMRHIRDAGTRMAVLIDSVQSYTQLDGRGAIAHEAFELNEAVACAQANLSTLIGENGATFDVEGLPRVTGSIIQIIQVLQNLIANAISHCPGPVHISIGARRTADTLCITVRDNGPGIAPEDQGQIFVPFRRLNRDNAHCGLGLAICQRIVESHDGKIGCTSAVGTGSSFFFTMPEAARSARSTAQRTDVVVQDAAKNAVIANVLLIDDRDDDILFARKFLLGPRGMICNFLVAHNGRDGLAMIRERARANDPVDLVLVDINMPVMNGFEMLAAIGQDTQLSQIPVVMCSGSTWDRDRDRARALGAIGYLTKPPRFADLRPVIAGAPGLHLCNDAAGKPTLMRRSAG
jgi:signal transduction histidine kinase